MWQEHEQASQRQRDWNAVDPTCSIRLYRLPLFISSDSNREHVADLQNAINSTLSIILTTTTELEYFVGVKFYCPHALADGN